ncbi:MAG: hypothetical protein D6830_02610 [Ignavibacteria bacterium]|nr:MAG: hypothetical protein D6830_02610 [Ignavibacteria bacterium]
MKKLIFIILFLPLIANAQLIKLGEARGLFFSIGVGPRLPLGDFSINQNLGMGVNAGLSYTDNNFLPVFFFGKIGYQHYPGSQKFYKKSDYASFSSNVFLAEGGIRFYLKPLIENVAILMPFVEGGLSIAVFEKWHDFKDGTGKADFTETTAKTGFNLGAGLSVFLLEVVGQYHYLYKNQFLSLDLKIRIPIFFKI